MLFPRFKTVSVPQGYDVLDQKTDRVFQVCTKEAADEMADISNRYPDLYEEDFVPNDSPVVVKQKQAAYLRAQANV